MQKLYIFFDIDGVLNCADWNEKTFPINPLCLKYFADTVNFFKLKYEVHLIMSSSWRDGFSLEIGHSPDLQNILDKMKVFSLEVEDKTPFFMKKNRADEINFYIVEHNLQNFKCLAIDDCKHLFGSPLESNLKLYITDAMTGFCKKDFLRIKNDELRIKNLVSRIKDFFVKIFNS